MFNNFAVYNMLIINKAAEKIASTFQKLKNNAPAAPPRADKIGSHQGQNAANTANSDPKNPIPLFLSDCFVPITPILKTNSATEIITRIANRNPVTISPGVVFHMIRPNK